MRVGPDEEDEVGDCEEELEESCVEDSCHGGEVIGRHLIF